MLTTVKVTAKGLFQRQQGAETNAAERPGWPRGKKRGVAKTAWRGELLRAKWPEAVLETHSVFKRQRQTRRHADGRAPGGDLRVRRPWGPPAIRGSAAEMSEKTARHVGLAQREEKHLSHMHQASEISVERSGFPEY